MGYFCSHLIDVTLHLTHYVRKYSDRFFTNMNIPTVIIFSDRVVVNKQFTHSYYVYIHNTCKPFVFIILSPPLLHGIQCSPALPRMIILSHTAWLEYTRYRIPVVTSFRSILIFSFISASAWWLAWMRFTYLFRSFLTTSYRAENSFSRLLVSLHLFDRSATTKCFIFTCHTGGRRDDTGDHGLSGRSQRVKPPTS